MVFINGLLFKTDFEYEEKNNIEINENDDHELIVDTKNSLIHLNSAFKNSYLKNLGEQLKAEMIEHKNYRLFSHPNNLFLCQ